MPNHIDRPFDARVLPYQPQPQQQPTLLERFQAWRATRTKRQAFLKRLDANEAKRQRMLAAMEGQDGRMAYLISRSLSSGC